MYALSCATRLLIEHRVKCCCENRCFKVVQNGLKLEIKLTFSVNINTQRN